MKKSVCAKAAQSPFARPCTISGKIKLASSAQWIYSSLLQSKEGLLHILSPPLGTSFPPKLPTLFSNQIIPTRKSVSTNFLMQNYMQHFQIILDSMYNKRHHPLNFIKWECSIHQVLGKLISATTFTEIPCKMFLNRLL